MFDEDPGAGGGFVEGREPGGVVDDALAEGDFLDVQDQAVFEGVVLPVGGRDAPAGGLQQAGVDRVGVPGVPDAADEVDGVQVEAQGLGWDPAEEFGDAFGPVQHREHVALDGQRYPLGLGGLGNGGDALDGALEGGVLVVVGMGIPGTDGVEAAGADVEGLGAQRVRGLHVPLHAVDSGLSNGRVERDQRGVLAVGLGDGQAFRGQQVADAAELVERVGVGLAELNAAAGEAQLEGASHVGCRD